MSSFSSILKVQVLNTLKLNKLFKAKKSKKRMGVLGTAVILLLFAGFIGGMGYAYSWIYASTELISLDKVVALMASLSALVCLVFSFYSAGNVLYGAKDFDLLLSLPIKKSKIVLSKLAFSYILDFLFGLLLVVPSLIIYAEFGGILTIDNILRAIIILLFLPIIPMAISILLSALFLFVSSRFKHANIVQLILFLGVFLAYMLAMLGSTSIDSDFNMQLANAYFLNGLIEDAFISWQGTLIYVGINVVLTALVLYVVVATYVKINTVIKSKKTKSDFKLTSYKSSSVVKTLFKKEIKTLFAYPIYAMNTLMGPLLSIVLFVVALILSGQMPEIKVFAVLVLPLVYVFTFTLAPTTASSISMEGNSFWVIKTSPISAKNLLKAKIVVYYIFNLIPAVITLPISIYLIWGIGVEYYVLLAIIALSATLLAGNVGLIMNLLLPLLKWETPNRVVKQGGAMTITMLVSFVLSAIFALVFFVWTYQNILVKYIIIASLLLILTILTFIVLTIKGEKWLNERVHL